MSRPKEAAHIKAYRKTASFARYASKFVQAMVEDGIDKLSALRLIEGKSLTDVSKLRYQAVFLMGAGGSGKGYVGHKWMKYMPGAPPEGYSRAQMEENLTPADISEQERGLTNLNFEAVVDKIRDRYGITIEPADSASATIPFRLYEYGPRGEREIPPREWKEALPPEVYKEVQGLTKIVFQAPKHELPTYWRQVDPDLYKKELAGFKQEQPGYVHEMSSEMAKAYFEAVLKSGDPLFVDGTGSNLGKMKYQIQAAKKAGYRVTVVLVWVPLTINQIRNATRARNVPAMQVVKQWKAITKNFAQLRSIVDKAKAIDNRNDASDMKLWYKFHTKINEFIKRSTGGTYPDLYSLIKAEAPSELSRYGKALSIRD